MIHNKLTYGISEITPQFSNILVHVTLLIKKVNIIEKHKKEDYIIRQCPVTNKTHDYVV